MDVRSMKVAGVTISGTDDEDPADSHEDAGELLDTLVGNAETEEATKAKLKELNQLAEFGVYEMVDIHTALGKKRVTTRWDLDHRKDGIRARFDPREFKGDENNVRRVRAELDSEHGTRHRLLESQDFVSHIHSRRDFLCIFELDVCIKVHVDDLHGTGPSPAGDLVQTCISQKIRFKIWTVYEVG